jgi:undecaprenyl-diphosphatase
LLVSSSGHLLLGQHFLGVDQERFGLSFDASIHTGTVLAVVWFFRRDLLGMGRALARSWSWFDLEEPDQRMASKSQRANKLTFAGAIGIGLAQASALVPGVSRSGATITMGLFLGLKRDEAARFSFLMSVPVTSAAAALSIAEVLGEGIDAHGALLFLAGGVSSAVVGYLAIRFLLSYLAH